MIERLYILYPEIKEGIMATIIMNNNILNLTTRQIVRYERKLDGADKKRLSELTVGDQVFDLLSGQWETVLEVCIYEFLRASRPIRPSERYDKRVIQWIHVFGALFAPAAALRRFANIDGMFFICADDEKP
jgi:hypothetical protein